MSVPKPLRLDPKAAPTSAAWIGPVQDDAETPAQRHGGDTEQRRDHGATPEGGARGVGDLDARARRAGKTALQTSMLPQFAAAFAVRFGGSAAANQCPKHIADAQALIDRISARMESEAAGMPADGGALIRALLDDARFMLAAARHNHEHAQAPFDHARAFAKADVAFGHARAAEIMCARVKQQRC